MDLAATGESVISKSSVFGGTQTGAVSPTSGAIRVPMAGYTGHRMGYRAQNFYGKTYRDCSIQSKVLQNMAAYN